MRPILPCLAASIALASAGAAFAQPPATTGATANPGASSMSRAPGSTMPDTTMSGSQSSGAPTTGPATTGPATTGPGADSATTDGANTSATAGAAFQVGEPVKDNTGVTIGEISKLNAGANGQQMAVIKMGDQSFQVAADRLGAEHGAAEINLTQAQIAKMIGGASAAGGTSGR